MSVIASVVGFFLFVGAYSLLEKIPVEISYGGDKGQVVLSLLVGVPAGSIVGIVLRDRYLYAIRSASIYSVSVAALLGVLTVCLGIYLLDVFGGNFIFAIPFVVAMTSDLGYRIGGRVSGRPAE